MHSESEGESTSYDYEYPPSDVLQMAYGRHTSDTDGSSSGSSHAEGSSETEGSSSATSHSSSVSDGWADTTGSSRSEGWAETTGQARTKGKATTRGTAKTEGTTETLNASLGGSVSASVSESQSRGRGQAFRSVYEKLPTKEYGLEELVHLASVSIARLPVGTCLVKIGSRKVVRINCLKVKRRVISNKHLARVRSEMFKNTPFALSREEAEEEYNIYREELLKQLEPEDDEEDD